MKRLFAMLTAVLFLLTALPFRAEANSGPSRWNGTNSSGAVVTGENCPIVVEHEELVFDIQEFPLEHYPSALSYENYPGRVTAEYTFVNPTEQEVEVTLVFPFGMEPDYAYYDFDAPEKHYDWEKYGVSVDGQTMDVTVRHTLAYHGHEFDMGEDLALLHDGFMEDDFYRPDLPVTKYVWQISGVDQEKYNAAFAGTRLSADPARTKIWMDQCNGGDTHEGYIETGRFLDRRSEDTLTLYVMGEPLDTLPEWKLYQNGGMKKEIEGLANLVETVQMTLHDMVMVCYESSSGVLEHDWYNAIITGMKQNEWSYGFVGPDHLDGGKFDVGRNLMRWYEYTLTFQPGQKIVNTVTAPIYPAIAMNYDPYVYEYTYLLSPAALWADFGTLDITVNTPFYMSAATNVPFEWDNPGYSAHLDGLPEGELEFILSQSENPRSTEKTVGQFLNESAGSVLRGIVLVLGAAILAILLWKKREKKGNAQD